MITRNPAGYYGFSPKGPTTRSAPAPAITLTASGPVSATANSQVIENLHITATGTSHALTVQTFTDVIIRNCKISHITDPLGITNYHGIFADNADRLLIEDTEVTHNGTVSPIVMEEDNIALINMDNVIVRRVRLSNGTTGIYNLNGTGGLFQFIEGYNFRNVGNGPRGNLIQMNGHSLFTLEDFSVFNADSIAVSFPGDCVSVIQPGDGGIIRRGLIDGNNSVSGVGLMAESVDGLTVEDVDCLNMGNGAFSNWPLDPFPPNPDCTAIVWTRCRTKDSVITDRGRGIPSSSNGGTTSGLQFAATGPSAQTTVTDCLWYNQPAALNTLWETGGFVSTAGITEGDFTANSPIVNSFDWE